MTRLDLTPRVVAVVAVLGLALGVWAANGVIWASHQARPAVTRPAPAPNPSPVLTSTHGGAR